jgi:hypothetical protein
LHDATEQHDLLFMIAAAPLMARLMKADERLRAGAARLRRSVQFEIGLDALSKADGQQSRCHAACY